MRKKLRLGFSMLVFGMGSLLISASSCKHREDDPKEVAEKKNEAKFEDTKEKDADFLADAAEFHLQQSALGKLTAVKSNNEEVKAFGKMMEDTHNSILENLGALAVSKQISVPTSLTDDNKEDYNALNKKDIDDFDKQYVESVISNHKKAIDNYTNEMNKTADSDLKKWITMDLASLREHLDGAMTLQSKLNKN